MRVLVADDSLDLSTFLRRALSEEGFTVELAQDGETALHRVSREQFDVVVLDWMMPGLSGLKVVKSIREHGIATPVLLLTAKDTVDDVVEGLNAGADDYLTKPFKFAVLLARLHAISRRTGNARKSVLTYSKLVLDLITHKATWDGRDLPLLPKEESLLTYFLKNAESPLSRAMIYEHVWNDSYDGLSNTLEVHIKELRRRLEDAGAPKLIFTSRGRGYIMSLDSEP